MKLNEKKLYRNNINGDSEEMKRRENEENRKKTESAKSK
jgi:hypothetical protein